LLNQTLITPGEEILQYRNENQKAVLKLGWLCLSPALTNKSSQSAVTPNSAKTLCLQKESSNSGVILVIFIWRIRLRFA